MRKIGIPEIEDIALGAALLGAGGGGDPYIGKLIAMGAVQECGPVTLLDPEEVVIADVPYVMEELDENEFNFVIMFEDTEINREYLKTQFGITEEVGYIAGKPLH